LFIAGQALTGWKADLADRREHGEPGVSFVGYLTSGHFVEATFENWESEFLQMGAYVVLTALLVQKGSSESRPSNARRGREATDRRRGRGPADRGRWRLALYEHSLGITFGVLFAASFALHALGGAKEFSAEQVAHGGDPVGVLTFITTSEFWFQSFQNWQSEFFAVGTLVVLTIFLRERGSPESKPVSAPSDRTGS
jgi:Domain of unknown function (DUF6766)